MIFPSILRNSSSLFFFCNVPATTATYTLSLHDALPISPSIWRRLASSSIIKIRVAFRDSATMVSPQLDKLLSYSHTDRKSTRLNSSHGYISYAVFCLKKKNKHHQNCIFKKYTT